MKKETERYKMVLHVKKEYFILIMSGKKIRKVQNENYSFFFNADNEKMMRGVLIKVLDNRYVYG